MESDARIGRFTVIRELGRGAFATVYLAWDDGTNRHVAIKLLSTVRDSTDVTRFREEARTLGQFSHPHIVSVFEFGEHAGAPFIVMEYMAGGTILPFAACGDEERTRAIADDTLSGLAAIHATGRVHRDLKPQNLLLTQDGQAVKIADLGLARLLRSAHLTESGIAPGSPRYMAPEQAVAGGEVGPAADLYALGVICQELLVGTVPFENDDAGAMLAARIQSPPPPVAGLQPGLDPQLAGWVDRMIRRRPDDRPGTAAAASAALRGVTPLPAPGPTLGQAARWPAAVAFGLAVAAVAVITGEWWLLALAVIGYASLVAIKLIGSGR
jgi:serine/threonine protein kinase